MSRCASLQGRGKVFYVGGAMGGGCVRQQLAILQMGIGYNEFITMFYIQATFKLKNP